MTSNNNFNFKIKSIQEGDAVMVGKYVGIDFHDNKGSGQLTLVADNEIIGMVVQDDK